MNIVIAFSPNWIQYVQIGLFSLFSTNSGTMNVYLLSDDLDQIEIENCHKICNYFGQRCNVAYVNLKSTCDNYITTDINTNNRFGRYAMYRLFIPHIISDSRVLYIDADALVIGDINELYNINMHNNLLAGCVDTGIMSNYKIKIGMDESDIYLNSGMLLFNNSELIRLNIFDKWMHMANNVEFLGVDQDILNVTTQFQKVTIDPIYNTSLSTKYDIHENDIRIIHWAGDKPWNQQNVIYDNIWKHWEDKFNECFFRSIDEYRLQGIM